MRRILASLITHAYHPTKKAKGIVHEYAWLDKHPNYIGTTTPYLLASGLARAW